LASCFRADAEAIAALSGYNAGMSAVTKILSAIDDGDPQAADQLLPLVYQELRKLAAAKLLRENPEQTLQPTVLVHEAYLRLVDVDRPQQWNGRGHFFAAAAEAMRRILIENARQRKARKHGGAMQRVEFDELDAKTERSREEFLALDEALTRLEEQWPDKAKLVKLRYFAGLTIPEASIALKISTATAERHWRFAQAWLHSQLKTWE
jgi:RNA polymerase sigma factor (TIGR02999 family)